MKAEANRLGFSLFGVAAATPADGFDRYAAWLDRGYHGEMTYLEDHREARRNPAAILDGVRTIVMLAFDYASPREDDHPPTHGRVAAYARGPDYHPFLWKRLNALTDWLERTTPGAVAHGVADSAPLLERDFARRAGLGWFGKNTMLLNKDRGSFFFLSAVATNLDLPPDEPHHAQHCGTCTACLDACPTQAFVAPGTLDARRCISYLTIETKSTIPLDLRPAVGNWLFGCDVCQTVCPWNRHAASRSVSYPSDPAFISLDPLSLLAMTEDDFRKKFKPTPLFRPRWTGIRRNALIVLGNVGDECALPTLERLQTDVSELIRDAAAWAVAEIRGRHNRHDRMAPSSNLA